MRSGIKALCAVLISTAYGCNDSSFKRDAEKALPPPSPSQYVITSMGMDQTINGGTKNITTIDKVDLVIQAADLRILDQSTASKKQPVDLYFVLDMTATMQDEMDAVKDGVRRLTSELSGAGVDLRVGVVGFIDTFTSLERRTLKLTNDLNAFERFMNGVVASGIEDDGSKNVDYPEASLYAARKAVEYLRDPSSARAGALKTIVMITDVIGHNGSREGGGEPVRDCSVGALVTDINNLATADSAGFRFFYTVPDPLNVVNDNKNNGAFLNCNSQTDSTGIVAARQMESILDQIMLNTDESKRGGQLVDANGKSAWPLTQSNLVTTLVSQLTVDTTTSEVKGSCLATAADLKNSANASIYSWRPVSAAEVLAQYKGGSNELKLPNVLDKARAAGAGTYALDVSRCCIEQAAIDAGQLSTCKSSYTQRVTYTITQSPAR